MTMPRLTLRGLMFAVAILAVDLALLRVAVPDALDAIILTASPVLLLNVALVLAVRRTRPGRAFWAGYLGLGGLVTGSWILMLVLPAYYPVPSPNPTSPTIWVKSRPYAAWQYLINTPLEMLDNAWPSAVGQAMHSPFVRDMLAYPHVMSLHVGSGLLGGLIARWLRRRSLMIRTHPAAQPKSKRILGSLENAIG